MKKKPILLLKKMQPPVKKLKEKFIEMTPKESNELFSNSDFVCIGNTVNYKELVNSTVKRYEVGYIIKNRVKNRIIVKKVIQNLKAKRKEMADFFKKEFEYFIPFWMYESREKVDPREIGRMFGCKIKL